MRYTSVLLLLLALLLYGCEAKEEEDHSGLDEMVLLEKEEADPSLVTDAEAQESIESDSFMIQK